MSDIGLRYYRNNILNTDWYPEQDKAAARKQYEKLLDEFNRGLIQNFSVLRPDKTVINVKKTVDMTYVIFVRFVDGGKLYPYKSDEEIPSGQEILVDGGGHLQVLKVAQCRHVSTEELNALAEGHKVKPVLAICVKSMRQVKVGA